MNTLKQALVQLVLAIIMLALVVWVIRDGQEEKAQEVKQYWEDAHFKTDSQKVYIDYSKIPYEKFINYVPPAVNIQYIDSTRSISNTTLVMDDSLIQVIDSLNGVITSISKDFLLNYPHAPKLIYALFSKDTILLDLLNIRGELHRQIYPVDFSRFKYQFTESQFRANSLPSTSAKNSFFQTSAIFVNGGYDLANQSPVLGSYGYTDIFSRWRLQADADMLIQTTPTFRFKATVGYRLREWRKE